MLFYIVVGTILTLYSPATGSLLTDIVFLPFGVLFAKSLPREERDHYEGYGLFFMVFAACTILNLTWGAYFVDATVTSYTTTMSEKTVLIRLLMIIVFGPLSEELLFRGCLYGNLRLKMPRLLTCVLTSLLFGAVHGTTLHLFIGTLFGIFLCYIYEVYEDWRHTALYHALYNALTLSDISLIPWKPVFAFVFFTITALVMLVYFYRLIKTQQEGIR